MNIEQLKALVANMIAHTDRDGYEVEDYQANAADIVDAARRMGWITEPEKTELYRHIIAQG